MCNYVKVPTSYQIGGTKIEVHNVERCIDNTIGICLVASGYIEIADKFNKDDTQSDDSKINMFYHELTHSILKTMGEDDLNNNERFVCAFSSFLTEAMRNAFFIEE